MMQDIRSDCIIVVGNPRGKDQRRNIHSAGSSSDLALLR